MREAPSYLGLARGEIGRRVEEALALMEECVVCPRRCRARRLEGRKGSCRVGRRAVVSSFGPHHGEEGPISGTRGSGTIFFAGCNLQCVFCQNYSISHLVEGEEEGPERLASIMLSLQRMGCHNVNLVTPSHVVPQFLEGLAFAVERGFRLPIVYNSGGYDSVAALGLLDGVVDIYMPDFKYGGEVEGERFSGVPAYPEIAMTALRAMHGQVGDLVLDGEGVAVRGMLVRHLVLPLGLAGTRAVMEFLSTLSRDTYVNLMDQYRPSFRADEWVDEGLGRRPTPDEVEGAVREAIRAGLGRFDRRGPRRLVSI